MKRDMELIRSILSFIEERCDGNKFIPLDSKAYAIFESSSVAKLEEHSRLVFEKGLAEGHLCDGSGWCFSSLTWEGRDFLDNARNSEVWEATKKAAGNLSFGVFRKVLEASATQVALRSLGM